MEAKRTPLIELLERVPRDAVLVVEHDQFSSSSHPVGRLCHEAAAALEAAREDAERYRWLRDRHDKTHQDWHVRDQWNNVPAIGGLDAAIDAAREARNG